jgi:hypothetical protein
MANADPRVSDKELAAINAAAVTREYRVQPHLGEHRQFSARLPDLTDISYRLQDGICYQWVRFRAAAAITDESHVAP